MFKRVIWTVALTIILAGPMARTFAADAHGETHAAAAQPAASAHGGGGSDGHGTQSPDLLPDTSKAATWFSALWVVIIFLVLLVVLYPTAWKNVLDGLKKREERIRNDIAEAEATRAKAEATLREYNAQLATAEDRVRQILADATTQAQTIGAQIRTQAEREAQEAKERAMRDIEGARKQAMAQIYDQAANLATMVAEKILRRNLNADDQRDLVNGSLDQLQNVDKK